MKKPFFYIILISQTWLTIGTLCTHIINPNHELTEIFNEEEKNEKEKEIEKELEKINQNQKINCQANKLSLVNLSNIIHPILTGRFHSDNFTPPPERA